MGIRRVTSSTPCLILGVHIGKNLSKSPSGAGLETLLTTKYWSRVLLATLQVTLAPHVPALWWRGLAAPLSQCASFFLNDVGRAPYAYVVVFFLSLAESQKQS
eukprot:1144412-Pelagomonas_calceolata.AAC.3